MRVEEIMTTSPRSCAEQETLQSIATAMAEGDFGSVVVVDAEDRPIGICTDRDIAIRAVAKGLGPDTTVGEIMSQNCCTIARDATDEEAIKLMEQNRVRRLPVVDGSGACCGILATADIARAENRESCGEVLQEISQPA